MQKNKNQKEYVTEEEVKLFKELFQRGLRLYKEKDSAVSDREWLDYFLEIECPEMTDEERNSDSELIVSSIKQFGDNLQSCNDAAKIGISKEKWLSNKIQEASVGLSVNEFGEILQQMDDVLYKKNMELADAISRSTDGHIMMSPNLDGNLAENMVAKTAEMSAYLQGKNISVQVLESHAENSVDVRAVNHDTGQYQNYQLKFGKDAKSTIHLLERGNYNNQRIVVPAEQLKEVQEHYKALGSAKKVTDHIEAWGVKSKSFTKSDMKHLQEQAQTEGEYPKIDYSHYQTKELALAIGKSTGAVALQAAAVTTGLDVVKKLFKGEEIEADELIEKAIKTGTDTSLKTVTAGVLQVAVRKGVLRFIPQTTPAGVIANIACVGIENVKILSQIAKGNMSATKGLDQMGRVTTSMVGGLLGMAKGAGAGTKMVGWIPLIGPALAVAGGLVGGMVGYLGGAKFGEVIYNTGKRIAKAVKTVAKPIVESLRSAKEKVVSSIKCSGRKLLSCLGF